MGVFGVEKFQSMQELLFHQLEDVYDAEVRLVKAIPRMQEAANNTELKTAFGEHHSHTQEHVSRLNQVFRALGSEPQRETCPAMRGLIEEAEEMVKAEGDPDVCDAALITSAQRIEHYEMAAYGTICNIADRLGDQDTAKQAQANLEEEKKADETLNQVANNINAAASAKAG